MGVKLKKLSEQVMFITGASSGIGLVTAREAARRGAKLVLVARAEDALRQLAEEINAAGGAGIYVGADVGGARAEDALRKRAEETSAAGGEAIYVVADVGREEEVRRVAEAALARFGRVD